MRARTLGNRPGSWNVRGRRPLLTPGLCDHGLIDLPAPGTGCLRRSLIRSLLPGWRAYSASTGDDWHLRLPGEKHSYPVKLTKRKKQREITTATGLPAPVPPGHRGETYKFRFSCFAKRWNRPDIRVEQRKADPTLPTLPIQARRRARAAPARVLKKLRTWPFVTRQGAPSRPRRLSTTVPAKAAATMTGMPRAG